MRKYLKFIVLGLALSGLSGLFAVKPVLAEDNDVLCAAVLPCDADGNVLPAFNQGACAEVYATQCANLASAQLGDKLNSCQDRTSDLEKQINKLQRQVRNLKRQQSK